MRTKQLSKSQAALRAEVIKSLAHPSRIQMVDALAHGELCVCELTELVEADISTVSRHLALLKSAGLVRVEKRGLNHFYSLNCSCMADFFRCVDEINTGQSRAIRAACC